MIKSSLFHYTHQCKNKQCDQDKGLEQHSASLSLSSFSQRAITTSAPWTGLKELNWLTENWWAEPSRCTGKLWEWKKCEALCPGPDQMIRGPSFLCCSINCLSFQNIVFDFKKHLKKIRPSPSEIQQQPPNPSWGGTEGWSVYPVVREDTEGRKKTLQSLKPKQQTDQPGDSCQLNSIRDATKLKLVWAPRQSFL